VLRAVIDGGGHVALGRGWTLRGQLLAGAKRFVDESSEDQWAQFSAVEVRKSWGRFSLGPYAAFRISRMARGVRDYAIQQARLRADWDFGRGWNAGLWGGFVAYQFDPVPDFSYAGPSGGTTLSKELLEGLRFTGWLEGYVQDYEGRILVIEGDAGGSTQRELCEPDEGRPCPGRLDTQVRLGGQLRVSGPWVAGVSYQVSIQRSNSEEPVPGEPGLEDVDRHRIGAFATVPLGWKVLLSVQGALQINDGDSLTDDLLLGDEDENRTNVQAQVQRVLWGPVSLVLRYAFYANQLGGREGFDFSRHTVFGGLTVRADGATVDDRASRR